MFANYVSDKSLDPEYIKNSVNSKGKKIPKKLNLKIGKILEQTLHQTEHMCQ